MKDAATGPKYKKYSQKSTKKWRGTPSLYEQLQQHPENKVGMEDILPLEPAKETIAALLVILLNIRELLAQLL